MLLETGEICTVSDKFLYIEVVEIFAALTKERVNFSTAIEV